MSFATYTPRYAAYCNAKGYATPEAQQQADGNMAGFIRWITAAWTAFGVPAGQSYAHQDAFDAWLPSFIQVTRPAHPFQGRNTGLLNSCGLRIPQIAGQGVEGADECI